MSWLARLQPSGRSVRIAPASADHADRMAEIHAGAFARPWSAEDFGAFLIDRTILIDALFSGQVRQPSGFVVSRFASDEAEILSVALARSSRGRGHSRRLLLHHLQALEDRGIMHVHLEVEEGNTPAIALYRRLGFVQSGQRIGYYLRPDGTRATALSMTLHLASRKIDGAYAGGP